MKKRILPVIAAILAAGFLIVLFFVPGKNEPAELTVALIAEGRPEAAQCETIASALTDALRRLPGHEKDRTSYSRAYVLAGTETEREVALMELQYGEGVICVADYVLVRDLLDDDALFAILPDELDADVTSASGEPIACRARRFPFGDAFGDGAPDDALCLFIRAGVTADEALNAALRGAYDLAAETLIELKNT